ncbi:MAG: prepilin-type N-terminal cleavage/methylation domain-containing protein [Planctomycetes bacterium]|nr:prepilin-type N-terminal cleavage/methylation domain-containing protein [Planctomycetota bacterium]
MFARLRALQGRGVSRRGVKAFTLVEVLIVVIVLGILAAIVVPQFSTASGDANLSALTTNLQTIRAQVELYRLQHNDTYPTLAAFVAQMTGRTTVAGAVGTDFGPYLMTIPANPFSGVNTVTNTGTPATTLGWFYEETTGQFTANDSVAHKAL